MFSNLFSDSEQSKWVLFWASSRSHWTHEWYQISPASETIIIGWTTDNNECAAAHQQKHIADSWLQKQGF